MAADAPRRSPSTEAPVGGAALNDVAVTAVEPDPFAVGLDVVVDRVVERLARHRPATPCIVGPHASGRTTALGALAHRLATDDRLPGLAGRTVWRVRAEAVVGGDRARAVRDARTTHGADGILAFDDLDVLLGLATPGVDLELRGVVRSCVARGAPLTVATIDAAHLGRLASEEAELYAELELVELPTWDATGLRAVGELWQPTLAVHHEVDLPEEVVAAAADRTAAARAAAAGTEPGGGEAVPGTVVRALDQACVRARLRHAGEVALDDLPAAGGATPWPALDPEELAASLRERVVGQDPAVERVARRLGLAAGGLDARPARPNGVFLLVGPTGVGKTALAKALAEVLFGGDDLLVRLDMSEYSDEASVNRLFGPQPGYLGSDRPEGWFTTRVLEKPTSVILLDELEKAHPTVWNVFLQVFDEGRLTDSRGRTVPFASTVVLATTNLGARAFSANPLGFGSSDADRSDARADVVATIERTLPPELLNRFDDVLVFDPLDLDEITAIAEREVARLVARLAERGWELDVPPEVVDLVARVGHDPAYGARHLQRNIERHLLEGLVGRTPGPARAERDGDGVRWVDGER